ncbi:IGHMBP2 family helicase [bacterium]|nr:IGHMBP2 family helicase [bacterium]
MRLTPQRLIDYRDAIHAEREDEMAFHEREIAQMSGTERQARGRALLDLKPRKGGVALGQRHLTHFYPQKGTAPIRRSAITRGDLVRVSTVTDPTTELGMGTVWELGGRITLATEKPLKLGRSALRLDLTAKETTFVRMETALETLLSPLGRRWRGRILGSSLKVGRDSIHAPPEDLDPAQQDAWRLGLRTRSLALVHGPPGTGKTVTAAAIAIGLANRGDRVLLAAPTNVAADNLVRALAKRGAKGIVRPGHPARMGKDLLPYALDTLVEERGGASLSKLREELSAAWDERTAGTRPSPRYRRGMSDEEIVAESNRGRKRGVPHRKLKEMATWVIANRRAVSLLDALRTQEDQLRNTILDRSPFVVVTCSSAGGEILSGITFDTAILDEAAQAPVPLSLIPLLKAGKGILVGDDRQLPPVVLSRDAESLGLSETLFEHLRAEHPTHTALLTRQYRMREEIAQFPSKWWYGGKLEAATGVGDQPLPKLKRGWAHSMDKGINAGALVAWDTAGTTQESRGRGETSWSNPKEAQLLSDLVHRLLERNLPPESIGVIVPYRGQRKRLRSLLDPTGVEVHTVDGFQGREKEVILLGFVRSNPQGKVGFLLDERRLNVALARGLGFLFLIGDRPTLSHAPLYKALWTHFATTGTLLPLT